ncbi:MAG: hypothetical protein ACRCY4_04165 [Brevinema sp.]
MKRCVLFVLTMSSAAYLYGQYYSGPNAEPTAPQDYQNYVPAQPGPNNPPVVYQDDVMPIAEFPDYAAEDYLYDGAVDSGYGYEDTGYGADYGDGYQDTYSPEEEQSPRAPLVDPYPGTDPNNIKSIIIQLPFTNITLTPPYAPYQTLDPSRLKSGRIPQLVSSRSLLQNLDKTIWRLKFYSHPDNNNIVESVLLRISEPELFLTTTMAPADPKSAPEIQVPASRSSSAKYRLTLVKSLRPGEGIYAYDTGSGVISFMYFRLIMPHLLAFDMARDFESIAQCPDKSLNDLGVFTLE